MLGSILLLFVGPTWTQAFHSVRSARSGVIQLMFAKFKDQSVSSVIGHILLSIIENFCGTAKPMLNLICPGYKLKQTNYVLIYSNV